MKISAYIPCYNNAQTIKRCIQSIRDQSIPVSELFVISDGSNDESVEIVKDLGVDLIDLKKNYGRGYVRAMAMEHAKHNYVLCCDATLTLEKDFIKKALNYFSDKNVGSVFGKVKQKDLSNALSRWTSRYLFHDNEEAQILHYIGLLTGGAILKKSLVLGAGNFNSSLKSSEDMDLGLKMNASGINTISDSNLIIYSYRHDNLYKTMERFWRWNYWNQKHSLSLFYSNIIYSLKVMVMNDLRDKDWLRIPISLIFPLSMLYFQIQKLLNS